MLVRPILVNSYKHYQKPQVAFKSRDFNFDTANESDGKCYAGDTSILDSWRDDFYVRQGIGPSEMDLAEGNLEGKKLTDVSLAHFQVLPNYSYSGECLMRKSEAYFNLLRPSGVYTVIDLLGNGGKAGLKERCEKYGVDYLNYDMDWGYTNQAIFQDEKELLEKMRESEKSWCSSEDELLKKIEKYKAKLAEQKTKSVNKLAKFIEKINKGHFYMSCEFGEYRTKNCLAIASWFNPTWPMKEKIDPTYEFKTNIINLYNNLTPELKQILHIDAEYDKVLAEYVSELAKAVR